MSVQRLQLMRPDEVEEPQSLSGAALAAWRMLFASMDQGRLMTQADLMQIEAGCRSWARWQAIEEQIAKVAQSNVLAGELSKGRDGRLETSPLRAAANAALEEFERVARQYGLSPQRMEAGDLDLFGNPARDGTRKPGRPRFERTPRDADRVRMLLALGWSNERIAGVLECCLPTLRRYFKPELKAREVMRDRLDARRFEIAMAQANAGNMTALKELSRMVERSDLMGKDAEVANPAEGREGKRTEGKKDLARMRAFDAESELEQLFNADRLN